jgi:SAM-dependent methyltransferase
MTVLGVFTQSGAQAGESPAEEIREAVGSHYAKVAQAAHSSCAMRQSPASGSGSAAAIYSPEDIAALPAETICASRGCADPHAAARLQSGERVLDLGCGGGIDCLLAAREVGPAGEVVGLDMTPEMLELARGAAQQSGVGNVRYVQGYIEDMPFGSGEFDVVISNCVINLSPNKPAVLREAFRVLKPHGRFVVADVVALKPLSPETSKSLAAFLGCTSGVLESGAYQKELEAVGFTDVQITVTQAYDAELLKFRALRKQMQAELMSIGIQAADSAMAVEGIGDAGTDDAYFDESGDDLDRE